MLLQSKASEQQEQIAELARRVEALEMERAELASKNAMLQKLATIRRDTSAGGAEAVSDGVTMNPELKLLAYGNSKD